jgi:hypothetical protein
MLTKTEINYMKKICDKFICMHQKLPLHNDNNKLHYSAVISNSGVDLLSYGINSKQQFKYMPTKHAEIDAITKIKNYRNNPKTINMVVIRINKNGIIGESRPCCDCLKMLNMSKFIIKYIYYSTAEGTIIKEKFSNMLDSPKNHISKGVKYRNNIK